MSPEELGRQLAAFQASLAEDWNNHGPDYVHNRISRLPHNELVELAMANIGAQAATS